MDQRFAELTHRDLIDSYQQGLYVERNGSSALSFGSVSLDANNMSGLHL
jgi:hypothetical protein